MHRLASVSQSAVAMHQWNAVYLTKVSKTTVNINWICGLNVALILNDFYYHSFHLTATLITSGIFMKPAKSQRLCNKMLQKGPPTGRYATSKFRHTFPMEKPFKNMALKLTTQQISG